MKDGNDDNGDNQPLSKRVRLAGYKRTSSTTPVAAISTSTISKTPSEGSEKWKKVHKSESIADQSLMTQNGSTQRARLWCGYRSKINLALLNLEKQVQALKQEESLSMKTTIEVSSKENTKDSGQKTEIDKLFIFKAEQSLVRKSKYLYENQSVSLRKDPQSTEELKSEAEKNKEPSYWIMSQRSQAIGIKSRGELGSKEMQRNLTNVTKLKTYPHPLVDRVGEEVTQKHLNKLISV